MINIKTRGQNQVVKRKNKMKPPNGGSVHRAEEKTKTKTNPQMGAVFVEQKKRKKKKRTTEPQNGGQHSLRKWKMNWPLKQGASTCRQKRKMKNELAPKMGTRSLYSPTLSGWTPLHCHQTLVWKISIFMSENWCNFPVTVQWQVWLDNESNGQYQWTFHWTNTENGWVSSEQSNGLSSGKILESNWNYWHTNLCGNSSNFVFCSSNKVSHVTCLKIFALIASFTFSPTLPPPPTAIHKKWPQMVFQPHLW